MQITDAPTSDSTTSHARLSRRPDDLLSYLARRSDRNSRGFDAPIIRAEDDLLDRSAIATAMRRLIEVAPDSAATRIGLYGEWGSGKSSVIQLLTTQLRKSGQLVVEISASSTSDAQTLWRELGTGIRREAANSGVPTRDRLSSVKIALTSISNWLERLRNLIPPIAAKSAKTAIDAHSGIPHAGEISGALLTKGLPLIKFSRDDFKRLISGLGTRRIVVIVDDIDRADPATIPQLLLNIRDLLDFPNFAYVLSFDIRIVARSLENYNQAWGQNGDRFIEKLVDFPIHLPSPNPQHVWRLMKAEIGAYAPYVPPDAIRRRLDVIPANPRKIKLIARILGSYELEVGRHDEEELEWDIILLHIISRTASDELASLLFRHYLEDSYIIGAALEINADSYLEAEKEFKSRMESSLEALFQSGRVDPALRRIVTTWREVTRNIPEEKIRYQLQIVLNPHVITWSEFRTFFNRWKTEMEPQRIRDFVQDRSANLQRDPIEVAREYLSACTGFYAQQLEQASLKQAAAENLEHIERAADALRLIDASTDSTRVQIQMDEPALVGTWIQTFGAASRWQHFNSNPREPELRDLEASVLTALARRLANPLQVIATLEPWSAGGMRDKFEEARSKLKSRIIDGCKDKLIEAAIELVRTPGRLAAIAADKEKDNARFLLTNPRSPAIRADSVGRIIDAIEARSRDLSSPADPLVLLDWTAGALAKIKNKSQENEVRQPLREMTLATWRLLASITPQYRFVDSIKKEKSRLDELLGEGLSPVPEWLQDR